MNTHIFTYISKYIRTNEKTGLQILMQVIIATNFVSGACFIAKWLTSRHTNKALSRVLWGYSSKHFILKHLQFCSNLQISTESVHVSSHHDFALWSHLHNHSPMLNQKIDINVRYGLFCLRISYMPLKSLDQTHPRSLSSNFSHTPTPSLFPPNFMCFKQNRIKQNKSKPLLIFLLRVCEFTH